MFLLFVCVKVFLGMNYGDLKLSIFIHYKYFVKTISSLISMSFYQL